MDYQCTARILSGMLMNIVGISAVNAALQCEAVDSTTQIEITCKKQTTEPIPPPPAQVCTHGKGVVQQAKWFVNGKPNGLGYLPDPAGTAVLAGSYAQEFTLTAEIPSIMISLLTHTGNGGAAGKEVAVSPCPNDYDVPQGCKRSFGSNQSTSILIFKGNPITYCDLPPGTYYLNIRPTGSQPASTLVTSYKLN